MDLEKVLKIVKKQRDEARALLADYGSDEADGGRWEYEAYLEQNLESTSRELIKLRNWVEHYKKEVEELRNNQIPHFYSSEIKKEVTDFIVKCKNRDNELNPNSICFSGGSLLVAGPSDS